jgi:hypothetical protein
MMGTYFFSKLAVQDLNKICEFIRYLRKLNMCNLKPLVGTIHELSKAVFEEFKD